MKGTRLMTFFSIIALSAMACEDQNQHEIFEGELSFKLIEIGSFYLLEDGLGDGFPTYLDSLQVLPKSTLSANETELLDLFTLLREEDLLNSKSFRLKTDKGYFKVYYGNESSRQIDDYGLKDLNQQGKKVMVKLRGSLLKNPEGKSLPIIKCQELIEIVKIDGKTDWQK